MQTKVPSWGAPETRAVLNLFKGYIGVGMLALPFAVFCGGIAGGLIGLLLLCWVAHNNLDLLTRSKYYVGAHTNLALEGITYPVIGLAAYGRMGFEAARFGLVATNFGTVVGYLIFCNHTLNPVIDHLINGHGHEHFDTDGNAMLGSSFMGIDASRFIVVPLYLVLTLIVDADKWAAPISLAGNIAVAAAIIVVLASAGSTITETSFDQLVEHTNSTLITGTPLRMEFYPSFLGIAALSVGIHCVYISIEDRMDAERGRETLPDNEKIERANSVSLVAITGVFLVYSSVAVVGLASYGDSISDSVLNSLPPSSTVDIMSALLCSSLIAAFPLFFSASTFVMDQSSADVNVGVFAGGSMLVLTNSPSGRGSSVTTISGGGDTENPLTEALLPIAVSAEEDECADGGDEFEVEAEPDVVVDEEEDHHLLQTVVEVIATPHPRHAAITEGHQVRDAIIAVSLLAVSVVMASMFGPVLSLVGALFMSTIAYILPPLFYMKLLWNEISGFEKVMRILQCTLGITILVVGTFSAVTNIVVTFASSDSHQCRA